MTRARAAFTWFILVAALAASIVAQPTVIEARAARPGDTLALILSGDGGWTPIDRTISQELNRSAISVVGFNSLRYFLFRRRTPAGAAADVEAIVRKYDELLHPRRLVLIGYSRGADVLPFIVNRLAPDLRAKASLIALLGPEATVGFELYPWDLVRTRARASDRAVLPEARALDANKVLCVMGTEETGSICPALARAGAQTALFAGGHHFGGQYREVAGAIIRRLKLHARDSDRHGAGPISSGPMPAPPTGFLPKPAAQP